MNKLDLALGEVVEGVLGSQICFLKLSPVIPRRFSLFIVTLPTLCILNLIRLLSN